VPKNTSKNDNTKTPVSSSAKTKKKSPASKSVSASKKPAAKKAPAKKAPAKKTAVKKAISKKKTAAKRPLPKAVIQEGKTSVKEARKVSKGKPLNKRELKNFQKLLLELRQRLIGDIQFLTTDNLHRAGRETGADLSGAAQHSADHGTDNFDREFALSLASTEQDVLYEVDEALMRIEEGEYGVCEMTGVQIERARLEVIPYTRYSVQAQAKMEQGRAKYRPFGQTFKGW
jgi:RNA polymerase-binding transcription factor DksA